MRKRAKKKFFVILALVIGLIFIDLFSLILLSFSEKYNPVNELSKKQKKLIPQILSEKSIRVVYSKYLGWEPKPMFSNGIYQYNSQGARANQEFNKNNISGNFRIMCFGDSFTHCDHVPNSDTWQSKAEKSFPNCQIINFGVGGYGLDQAYLRYLKKKDVYSGVKLVFVGFMTENIKRIKNVFRPFYLKNTQMPMAKPYFKVLGNELVLFENPMSKLDYKVLLENPHSIIDKLGQEDFFYNRSYKSGPLDFLSSVRLTKICFHNMRYPEQNFYHTDALDLTYKIFEKFCGEVKDNQATPVILIFPNMQDLKLLQNKEKHYEPLLEKLKGLNCVYIDFAEEFQNQKDYRDYFTKGHYNSKGNQIIADSIVKFLREM